MRRNLRLLFLILVGASLFGCAATEVKPWERGQLARWDMRWDPDPSQTAIANHAYFSKEGTSGEIGAAGGGCGCN
ncbi:MAG: DUF4266 domain-containing protein [Rudaea sp.]